MNDEKNRNDGRSAAALRPVTFQRGFTRYAEGSVLVSFGETRVLCNATVEESVPSFMRGQGRGWVTAEYSMLPRATHSRSPRESSRGKVGGRTHEIQRLIGRSLRAVVDLEALGERSIQIDCDVLQADGGTRTASITGAYVALADALNGLVAKGLLLSSPLKESVAAVSVGIVDGSPLLDLNYGEDSHAAVDMNFVITGSGRFVEVQGTAEEEPFSLAELDALRDLALAGCRELAVLQDRALEGVKMELVVATRNQGKLREIRALLEGSGITVLGLDAFPDLPEIEEDGATFEANARKKAVTVARATGRLTLADDSGLEVAVLDGRPGVHSARYAGETASDADNNAKLLQTLASVPAENRQGAFCCAMALCNREGECRVFFGKVEGLLLDSPRGEGGFGYDPLFLVREYGRTMAELPMEIKNRISHRGQALRQALEVLRTRV